MLAPANRYSKHIITVFSFFFFFQAEDGIRDYKVTGVQTCALPILVIVKDIDFFSLCVPSKQVVNAVRGAKPARLVKIGDRLWTLERGYLKETVEIGRASCRERV